MTKKIHIKPESSNFAEDKEEARRIREVSLIPTLERNGRVILDFTSVSSATQSYVHALIGEALKRYGEQALDRIDFKNCSPTVRSVIELVVDYSLGGFPSSAEVA